MSHFLNMEMLLPNSLSNNQICGLNVYGRGTYTAEGIIAISEMLKVNRTLQSVRCDNALAF